MFSDNYRCAYTALQVRDVNQWCSGATNAGLIRGAYHFAHPDTSTGAAQATFFAAHGGGWSADGITLPGAIDLEGAHTFKHILWHTGLTHKSYL